MRNDIKNTTNRKEKLSLLTECLFSDIDELANTLIYGDGINRSGFLRENPFKSEDFLEEYQALCKSLSYGDTLPSGVPNETAGFLFGARDGLENLSRAYLCAAFCRKRAENRHPLSISDFFGEGTASVNSKIAYMRSGYADEASGVFSRAIKKASVVYSSSFATACEEVYYGKAGYCILPYETSTEGNLSSFRGLVSKYELRPVLTCSVSADVSEGGQITMRLALCSKNIQRIDLNNAFAKSKVNEYLKITLSAPAERVLNKALSAASLNGLVFIKTESSPVTWDKNNYSSSLTFLTNGEGLVPFLLYLLLEAPESVVDGIYFDIE